MARRLALNGPTPPYTSPPASTATYFKLAATRGLRKTEMWGSGLCRPYLGSVLQPVGSRTTSIVNSGFTGVPSGPTDRGQGNDTRNRPRFSNKECESGSSCGKLGQLEPSIAANTGSLP